ncbi:histidine kinase [Sulfurimonas sp. MAG313]|nr:7TM diverse intracellular signaling domain-containing protein [Sulfurimonas sp. MAG313]MDF1879872.1 histidine kinase [Sulfurimonas sp. MAG313]
MLKICLGLVLLFLNANASGLQSNETIDLLFFGGFGMMLIASFGYFMIIKDNAYVHYFLFHSFALIIMLFYTQTLDPKYLEFSMQGVPLGFFFLSITALLAFTRDFLDLKARVEPLALTLKYLQFISLGFFALSSLEVTHPFVLSLGVVFVIFTSVFLLGTSIYLSLIKKQVYAQFYLLGFLGIFTALLLSMLSYFSLVPAYTSLVQFIEFSLLVEAGVFSFALSYKHKVVSLSLRQNELLFKELSHRVQNNLQQVLGILSLQKRRVSDSSVKKHLQDTINRIMSISKIHQTLQHSNRVGLVPMQMFFNDFIEHYQALHEGIDFHIVCDEDLYLDIDALTSLAIIMNELITNSAKYAFNDISQPKITLSLSKKELYDFTYTDNGPGYKEITESLGSSFIKGLSTSNPLNGKFEIEHHNTFVYSLKFPF